jgi:hypothetical protein
MISQPVPSRNETMIRTAKKSSIFILIISWIIVIIPLGWGVVQSVVKSLPLFQMSGDSR